MGSRMRGKEQEADRKNKWQRRKEKERLEKKIPEKSVRPVSQTCAHEVMLHATLGRNGAFGQTLLRLKLWDF